MMSKKKRGNPSLPPDKVTEAHHDGVYAPTFESDLRGEVIGNAHSGNFTLHSTDYLPLWPQALAEQMAMDLPKFKPGALSVVEQMATDFAQVSEMSRVGGAASLVEQMNVDLSQITGTASLAEQMAIDLPKFKPGALSVVEQMATDFAQVSEMSRVGGAASLMKQMNVGLSQITGTAPLVEQMATDLHRIASATSLVEQIAMDLPKFKPGALSVVEQMATDFAQVSEMSRVGGAASLVEQLAAIQSATEGGADSGHFVTSERHQVRWLPEYEKVRPWLIFMMTVALQLYLDASQSKINSRLVREVQRVDERAKEIERDINKVERKQQQHEESVEERTVVTRRVDTHVRPDSQSIVSGILYPNDIVEPISVDSSWSKVKYEKHVQGKTKEGWVPNSVLKTIDR